MSQHEHHPGCEHDRSDADSGGLLSQVARTPTDRRQFIKGVISSGAAVSSASYLFRSSPAEAQSAAAGAVERMITLSINGKDRRVDVTPNEIGRAHV